MKKFLHVLLFTATLAAPITFVAQADDKVVVYQDRGHHDSHEWNNGEDQRYRTYLQEHHRKYRDFGKLSRKDQDAYWNWRHSH